MPDYPTLTAALDARAAGDGLLTFIDGEHDERELSFTHLRLRALSLLSSLRGRGLEAGDRLILFVDDNARFVEFFWAALYGGIVPVPVAAGASDAHRDKLLRIWRHLGEPAVVTDARNLERLLAYAQASADAAVAARLEPRILSDELPAGEAAQPMACTPRDTAFIQFSSGSTGDPKGVVLSHANITANLRAISQACDYAADEIALSWMPLTHDMGLIGFHLVMLANGFDHHIMRTDVFARRPLLWLLKASEKRATLLCSPNFGYRHTLRAIAARGLPEVDLSAVRLIYNGAEPIAPALAREFLRALEGSGLHARSMFTVYGLAEASLAVTFPPPGRGLDCLSVARDSLGVGERVEPLAAGEAAAVELARLGRPIPECRLRIAGDDGAERVAGVVGHVQITGANVTAGYVDNPDANAVAFTADGWLDTGDLGFIDGAGGELVITGRAKEIIFVNGQNYYPQDLEAVAMEADGVDLNKVVAAGVRPPAADADELVLFVLFRGAVADFVSTAREVATLVNRHTGLAVARVVPVRQIPKTTSGKLQRGALAQAYAAGEFEAVAAELDALLPERGDSAGAAGDADGEIVAALKAICDEVVPDKNLGFEDNLFEVGLSSLELAQIHEGIEERWPDRLDVTDLFDYPSINALAGFLAEDAVPS